MGEVRFNSNKCITEINIANTMGAVKGNYIPTNCSSRVVIKNTMGSIRLTIEVPKGTRVIFAVDDFLGSSKLVTPEGRTLRKGSWGEGNYTLFLEGHNVMGSVTVELVG